MGSTSASDIAAMGSTELADAAVARMRQTVSEPTTTMAAQTPGNGLLDEAASGSGAGAEAGEAIGAEVQLQEVPDGQPFSWLDPHPIFVIILVGAEEQPFGIQKDFLCAKSSHYRSYFAQHEGSEVIEHIVKLPDTPVQVFAYAQNFLFTGNVFESLDNLPSYDVLVGVWKLGHQLGIEGLCDRTLEAMAECRRVTQHIPATPLLVQVWKDTPEGSSIRKLLLSWAAEYMRSSDSRAEFARSLPQEVLSELVVAMSSLNSGPILQPSLPQASPAFFAPAQRKNVHYLEPDDSSEAAAPAAALAPAKRSRHSDALPNGHGSSSSYAAAKAAPAKKPARASLPAPNKPGGRRRSAVANVDQNFSPEQKINFCSDLLTRMLSGPGFWTRLVGPFKEPVDPETDGVPDYLDKIKSPMDLGTMKAKMDRREYANEDEFARDMRQIFTNCYTYWTKKDPMWGACERLEKTFEEKFSQMNKWIAKMEGDEAA